MLNKAPTKYALTTLLDYATDGNVCTSETNDGRWVPARPEGYFLFWNRVKYAWMVFTGKADIVIWPGDQ